MTPTRSERPQTRKIDHPRPREMDTSRIDGVKAPQHFKTRRSHLALLLLLLEIFRKFDRVVVRLLRLLVGVRRLADDPCFNPLLLVRLFGELLGLIKGLLRSLQFRSSERLLVVRVVGRGSGWRRRLRLQLQFSDRHGHQISFFRRFCWTIFTISIDHFVVPILPYCHYFIYRRRVVPRYRLQISRVLVVVLLRRETRTSEGHPPSRRKRM